MPTDLIDQVLSEVGFTPDSPDSDTPEESNKAACIREALAILGEDAKPTEVVEWIKINKGKDVTTAYVSLVKSQSKSRQPRQQPSAAVYLAAKTLIHEAGGVTQAKSVLSYLETEQQNLLEMKERYTLLLKDAERTLNERGAKMRKREKSGWVLECRRLRRLIGLLENTEALYDPQVPNRAEDRKVPDEESKT